MPPGRHPTPFGVTPSPPVFLQICEQLIRAIQAGDYPVGSALPGEVELSRLFAVSRPSVREALSALQFAGYVEGQRGRGTMVRSTVARGMVTNGPQTVDEVIDGLEVRALLEPEAVGQAAQRFPARLKKELNRALTGMALAVDRPELRARTDLSVHLTLLRACPNRVLAEQVERLLAAHEGPAWHRIRSETWSGREEPKRWLEHHQQIFDAVSRGDVRRAKALCREHLVSVVQTVERSATTPRQRRRLLDLVARLEGGDGA